MKKPTKPARGKNQPAAAIPRKRRPAGGQRRAARRSTSPNRRHRRVRRRTGSLGTVCRRAGGQRHGLCHRPAPGPDAQGHHGRSCSSDTTAMKVHPSQGPHPGPPDCVYVIPPNKDMSILHGFLYLLIRVTPRGLRLPIDFFFRSLADDSKEAQYRRHSFGHGHRTARWDSKPSRGRREWSSCRPGRRPSSMGMPRSAIRPGWRTLSFSGGVTRQDSSPISSIFPSSPSRAGRRTKAIAPFEKIVICAVAKTGHDFSLYKKNTVYSPGRNAQMGIHRIRPGSPPMSVFYRRIPRSWSCCSRSF